MLLQITLPVMLNSIRSGTNLPDAAGLRDSLQKGLDSIEQAGTWDLNDKADVSSHVEPIDSRLVLATKIDPNRIYVFLQFELIQIQHSIFKPLLHVLHQTLQVRHPCGPSDGR